MSRKLLFLILSFCLFSLYGIAGSSEYFRIARLSYLEGKVSFQHTDEVDWSAASINMALQPGDRFYTGDNGRAEIEFDDGSVLRLAERTDIEILSMKEQLIQVRVLIGLCSLINHSSVEFEINTPAAAFTTAAKGSYRFDVAENGETSAIVRRGLLEAVNNYFSRNVETGEVLRVPADQNGNEVLSRYSQRDAWDEWNDRRNAEMVASESRRYIPDQVYYGVSDLDRYGRWSMVDGYGYAWIPRVSVYWSPYWEGRWCYRPYWGWTWVSYEPWGWLPYHYGRWFHSISSGWCWLPGPSFSFHFWSPGLVRFYRGPDWVSWCALGPGDYYNVNNYYYNNTYVYYLNNLRLLQRRGPEDLMNRASPGAMRMVRSEQFVNGSSGGRVEPIAGSLQPGRTGRIVTGALDIQPTGRSYVPEPGRIVERPGINSNRAVVVRTDPQVGRPNERYQRITSPQIARPPARGESVAGEPSRSIGSIPNGISRRADDTSDRNNAPARIYQVPQTRSDTRNPANNSREVQRGSERQEVVPRAQQPPAGSRAVTDTPARRMESQPPRSIDSNPSRMQRNDQSALPARPQVDRPIVTPRQETARPQSPPPATNKPPDAGQVIKKMDTAPLQSSYVDQPRSYQPSASSSRSAPSWSGARGDTFANARNSGTYSAGSSYGGGNRAVATRAAPQSGVPRTGSEPARRRNR